MMKRRITAPAACLVISVLLSLQGRSQGGMEFRSSGGDSVKTVLILNDDRYRFEQKDSATGLVFLVGHVELQEDRTLIYCDSMIRNSRENHIECFGHVRIFDGDSTNIYSDYMKYEALSKNVLFQKNVKLTDGKGVLTTQELDYNMNTKIGVYVHGGKVVNNGSVLTSDEATYYEETKDVRFRKNVVLRDPQYDLSADSLLYNTQTQISTFITETYIQFKDSTQRTVHTKEGFYDLKNRKAQFGKRSLITDGSQRITGDSILIDDSTGRSVAMGNAVYKDTTQGLVVIADYMVSDKKKNTFLATKKPLMIIKEEKDSLYLTADTLRSGRLVDEEVEEAEAARQDSLHQLYVDSLYKVTQDSLHRAEVDRQNRLEKQQSQTGVDSAQALGSDSTHQIIVKDESRDRVYDSLHVMPPDSSRASRAIPPPRDNSHYEGQLPDSIRSNPSATYLLTLGSVSTAMARQQAIRDQAMGDSLRRVGMAKADSIRKASAAASDSIRRARKEVAVVNIPTPTDSTLRYIKAFHHVRIFSDSLQAVSDSLFYSGKDSIFRLFQDPVAWGSGNYQVTGDTMFVYTKNKKADRLYVFENALAINKVGPNFYNQIKGTTINAFFKDGQMDFMRAKGSAESIYYVRDDNKAYTGVNKAHADIIDMIFENKELNRVVLRNDAEGSMIPFKKVNFDDMRLRGWKWLETRRPKSKFDLIAN